MRRDSAPAVLRHEPVKQSDHVQRSKGVRESLRIGGRGGRTSVPGAADRSVPTVGVGVRSTVVNRSGTLFWLQEIGKLEITSAARLRLHERKVQLYPEATRSG